MVSEGYEFTIIDLRNPDFFTGFIGVFDDTSEVNITIPYTPELFDESSVSSALSKQLNFSKASQVGSSQNGTVPFRMLRSNLKVENGIALQKLDSSVVGCGAEADGGTYFTTISARQGSAETCNVNYIAPEGVTGVEVEVEVLTDEHPLFTMEQSEFDNRWKYAFAAKNNDTTAGPSFFQEGGRVNQTHATGGIITVATACVQIAEPLDGEPLKPLTLTGTISATNIGDDTFPTKVSVKVSEGCGKLLIEEVKISSPNQNSYDIISPKNITGNIKGRYLSMPITSPDGAEVGIP